MPGRAFVCKGDGNRMKLLIADDELLTREGLASSIDWESMGIYQDRKSVV